MGQRTGKHERPFSAGQRRPYPVEAARAAQPASGSAIGAVTPNFAGRHSRRMAKRSGARIAKRIDSPASQNRRWMARKLMI